MVRRGGRKSGKFRLVFVLVIVCAGFWAGGLFWFAAQVSDQPTTDTQKTDAIVVLTGGSGRLDTGLELLSKGLAPKLFVSGVARGVDVKTLLRIARRESDAFACCVVIGYKADNTAGNATETREWIEAVNARSLRLVTANYHMPRSMIEFRRALPGITIVPHPVFPSGFSRSRWWSDSDSAILLISEYNKYLVARLRALTTMTKG